MNGHQFLGKDCRILSFNQFLFDGFSFYEFKCFINLLNSAKLFNEWLRCFFSDSFHARNIIGSISYQSQEINDLLRKYAHFFFDLISSVHIIGICIFSRTQNANTIIDELEIIFVGGQATHIISQSSCLLCQCSYDIISFKSR